METGELKEAAEMAKGLLDRDPNNAQAVQLLATIRRNRPAKPPEPPPPPAPAPAASARARPARSRGCADGELQPARHGLPGRRPIGRAPLNRRNLAPGTYTLQVRAPGHRPYETSIRVAAGREVSLNVPLVSDSPPPSEEREPIRPLPPLTTTRSPPPEAPPPPAPVPTAAAAAPAPLGKIAPTPPKSAPEPKLEAVMSVRPKDQVPVPRLARTQEARSGEELARLFAQIETQTVTLAGLTPEFAQGVTGPLRRALETRGQMVTYPAGVYYFIVAEAARGHDKRTAAQNLLTLHQNEGIRRLSEQLGPRSAK